MIPAGRAQDRSSFHVARVATIALACSVAVVAFACGGTKPQGTGLVVADAGAAATATSPEAGPVDVTQCAGCQLAPTPAWTFEGIYRDATCTEPLAQSTVPSCGVVAALAQASLTYVDEVGLRKANESATVTLTDQVAQDTPRFRKTAKGCVKANEGAIDITPVSCFGSRVCRDQAGALTCTTCRTFATGCPDFEETRIYATINDPGIKGKALTPGGNLARLGQCCAAIAAEARRLGASPEAGMLFGAAAQCQVLVSAAGPNGNAPELGALRAALAGRNVPGCAGF